MNLLAVLHAAVTQFSCASLGVQLLIKATLLLAVAWLLHFSFARANPRWRTLLWRGIAVGILLMVVWLLGLPGIEVRIPAPAAVAAAPAPLVSPIADHLSAIPADDSMRSLQDPSFVESPGIVNSEPPAIPPEAAQPAKPWRAWWSWPTVLLGVWGIRCRTF
jgi:hypothetical protein